MFKVPESNRLKLSDNHPLYSEKGYGNNGAFLFDYEDKHKRKITIFAIASDGTDWEHVSVTVNGKKRCPKWEEMCFIKSQFWSPEDRVIQYHPPEDENRSFHDYCLHLWRPVNQEIPAPDSILVAPKGF